MRCHRNRGWRLGSDASWRRYLDGHHLKVPPLVRRETKSRSTALTPRTSASSTASQTNMLVLSAPCNRAPDAAWFWAPPLTFCESRLELNAIGVPPAEGVFEAVAVPCAPVPAPPPVPPAPTPAVGVALLGMGKAVEFAS